METELDEHELKSALQNHLSNGLAIVVGSGLSCAEGIAGMGELAEHLSTVLPTRLNVTGRNEWEQIAPNITAYGLEAALMKHEPSATLDAAIAAAVIELICPQEGAIISRVISGQRTLKFSRLIPHLLKPSEGVPILTTNYDRLVEVACEAAGLHVDNGFDGSILGMSNPEEAEKNLVRSEQIVSSRLRRRKRPHARVFKPHGSLDWYQGAEGPVRYVGDLNLNRLIVTPGRSKLRKGYDKPFDEHRDTINRIIERSTRFLIIGYGFNDDHLETRLTQKIGSGTPTLLLTRDLSAKAKSLALANTAVIAIERADDISSRIFFHGKSVEVNTADLWDLAVFVDEVLNP